MLKLSDLALRPDLQLGPMLVSPSRRLVEGPGGHAHVEPLIMQVFLLLLDAGGKVVTRNELFDQCWGGVMVGDDSLNRAIAKVRRTGAQVRVKTDAERGESDNGCADAAAEAEAGRTRRSADHENK